MKIIEVPIPGSSYNVYTGSGIINKLPRLIANLENANNCLFVVDKKVIKHHTEVIDNLVQTVNGNKKVLRLTASEKLKSETTLNRIYETLLKSKFNRDTVIIAIGGGITGDVAGYAAATYMRGVKYVNVPTTLLASVDSSVGGKTGINFGDTKNVIGAFHQPEFVLIDTNFLQTLPTAEVICGFGEIVKYGFLTEKKFYNYLLNNAGKAADYNDSVFKRLINESVKIKADVVSNDEKEKGLRKILNLGHTFAHALEVEQEHKIKHGQAVVFGISCALFLSSRLGIMDNELTGEYTRQLEVFSPHIKLKQIDKKKVHKIMQRDKKNKAGSIKFVLIKDIGEIVTDVEASRYDVYYAIGESLKLFTKDHTG